MKAVILSLKQYHTYHYELYKKGMTRAMVGLQGLHLGDAFRCSNIYSSVGLKSFCPWCFKLGGSSETIATHLREVHYRLTITCDLCKSFASMSAQSVLDQHSGCKAKHAKEHAEQEVHEKAKKSHKKKSKVWKQETILRLGCVALKSPEWLRDAQHFLSNSIDEHGLIHSLDLPSHSDPVFWVSFHSTAWTVMFLFHLKCL